MPFFTPINRLLKGIVLIIGSLPAFVFGQIAPGGVKAPAIWLKNEVSEHGVLFKEVNSGKEMMFGSLQDQINGFPVGQFDYTKSQSFLLSKQASNLTVFPVIKSAKPMHEDLIWQLHSGENKSILMQTSRRFADFQRKTVLNNPLTNEQYSLHVYDAEIETAGKEAAFSFFGTPEQKELTTFEGQMPEAIVYDRILSLEEHIRVETYLALKYSIPLHQEKGMHSYLASDGTPLFDNEGKYLYNSFGLAKDDKHGFIVEESADQNKILKMASQKPEDDLAYLIAAHDDGQAVFLSTIQDRIEVMDLMWKIQNHRWSHDHISLNFDVEKLDLEKGQNYTLLMKSGNHQWMVRGIFIENQLRFEVKPPLESAHVSLLRTPDFFALVDVKQEDCLSDQNMVSVLSFGGSAPFQITRSDMSGRELDKVTVSEENYQFETRGEGLQKITITDKGGKVYSTTFALGNATQTIDEASLIFYHPIKLSDLELPKQSRVIALQSFPFSEELAIQNPDMEEVISEEGDYWLSYRDHFSCVQYMKFGIRVPASPAFKSVEIAPNPTNGNFNIKYEQIKNQNVEALIWDSNHRLIAKRKLGDARIGNHQMQIKHSGIFLVELSTGQTSITKKIVVL